MYPSRDPRLTLESKRDVETANEALLHAGDLRYGGTGEDFHPIRMIEFPSQIDLRTTRAVIQGLWKIAEDHKAQRLGED